MTPSLDLCLRGMKSLPTLKGLQLQTARWSLCWKDRAGGSIETLLAQSQDCFAVMPSCVSMPLRHHQTLSSRCETKCWSQLFCIVDFVGTGTGSDSQALILGSSIFYISGSGFLAVPLTTPAPLRTTQFTPLVPVLGEQTDLSPSTQTDTHDQAGLGLQSSPYDTLFAVLL